MNQTNTKYTLKQWRAIKGLSRYELAEAVGVDYNTIMHYENDVNKLRRASFEKLESIANALGIKVDDIFLNNTSV